MKFAYHMEFAFMAWEVYGTRMRSLPRMVQGVLEEDLGPQDTPKVRHTIWRMCHDILPTKDNLKRQGILVSPECVCGVERRVNLLFTCYFCVREQMKYGRSGGDE